MVLLFNIRYLERYNYSIPDVFATLIFIWSWLRKVQINVSLCDKIPVILK